jgi:hypothetical protein
MPTTATSGDAHRSSTVSLISTLRGRPHRMRMNSVKTKVMTKDRGRPTPAYSRRRKTQQRNGATYYERAITNFKIYHVTQVRWPLPAAFRRDALSNSLTWLGQCCANLNSAPCVHIFVTSTLREDKKHISTQDHVGRYRGTAASSQWFSLYITAGSYMDR